MEMLCYTFDLIMTMK